MPPAIPIKREGAIEDDNGARSADLVYEFESFRLDPAERCLTRNGHPISLTPKAFDTLCVLVENSGRLLSKAQLLDKVWPETYVEEKTLAQNVFTLRKVLGTYSEGGNYIETIPKLGYRFTANVNSVTRSMPQTIKLRPEPSNTSGQSKDPLIAVGPFDSLEIPHHEFGRRTISRSLAEAISKKRLLYAALLVSSVAALFLAIRPLRNMLWSKPMPFEKVQVIKLTSSGDVGSMALSREGKFVAYAKRRGATESLVLRQTEATTSVELLGPAPVVFLGVTFAPDGNSIFYVTTPYRAHGSTAYRIPILGGTPKEIARDVDSPVTFSPNGSRIAFVRSASTGFDRQLVVANADGSQQMVLGHDTGHTISPEAPAWSPDGTVIAVSTTQPRALIQGAEIALVNTQNGSVKTLGTSRWHWLGQMTWLPGGDELLITAASPEDPTLMSDQIWAVSYPSGEARRITNDVNGHFGIGVSSDLSRIASVVSVRTAAFWIVDGTDLKNARQITRVSGDRFGRILGMSWMSDETLVYSSMESGSTELWRMNSDGNSQRQLTFDRGINTMPIATRDLKYIVYLSRRGGERHVWRMNADGSNAKQLTATPGDAAPSLTPDGKWIVYSAFADKQPALWKISIDGGDPISLSDESAISPSISPDGKSVACYVLTSEGRRRLSILSFESGKVLNQFDIFQGFDLPVIKWKPDGEAVTFVQSRDGVSNIWEQTLSGGSPRQLTYWNSDEIFRFDWSRSGRLVVERGTYLNDIVLIQPQR